MATLTNPTVRWLSRRVRIVCIAALCISTLLPEYIPTAAIAVEEEVSVATPQFLLVEEGFLMKSSSLTEQGSRRAFAEGVFHTVRQGETLNMLAEKYAISVQTIRWANNIPDSAGIKAGDELLILPVNGVVHKVARGQTLIGIADLYDVKVEDIAAQNKIEGGFILSGQELIIPGGRPIAPPVQVAATPTPSTPGRPTTGTKPITRPTAEGPSTPPQNIQQEPTEGVLQKPCGSTCFITQYYNGGHYALDMQVRGGGPIYAAEAGTVIRAETGWNGGYGNVIEIDHGNGLVTLYGHNKELYVEKGDTVTRGQVISWMGNSGRVYGKTGIHVHFEVRAKGVKKNPLLYIQE